MAMQSSLLLVVLIFGVAVRAILVRTAVRKANNNRDFCTLAQRVVE